MIDFNRPAIVGRELEYIKDAVNRGMLCGDGAYSKKCAAWMQEEYQVNHVLLTPPVPMPWRWPRFWRIFSRGMR